MIKKQYVKSRKIARITFELAKSEIPEIITPENVFLVGEFNNWDTTATPMKYSQKKEAFSVSLDLEPGRRYQFRYLVNGIYWCNDWAADAYVPSNIDADNCIVATPVAANPDTN